MSKIVDVALSDIRNAVLEAAGKAVADGKFPQEELPSFTIEVPADRTHGDYAVNAAMVWARALHNAPRKIAETLGEYFDFSGTYIDRFEIAGPGFINIFLSARYYSDILKDVEVQGENYGRSTYGGGKKVLVEFVDGDDDLLYKGLFVSDIVFDLFLLLEQILVDTRQTTHLYLGTA